MRFGKGRFYDRADQKRDTYESAEGTAVSQLTLDDDFIVPDALDDAVQILLSDGEVQIENSRIQEKRC